MLQKVFSNKKKIRIIIQEISLIIWIFIFVAVSYYPGLLNLGTQIKPVLAEEFKIQTGGYVGNGDALVIDNLGFAPDLVIIKPSTTAGGGAVFRTSSMIDNVDAFFIGTANGAGGIALDTNGFRVSGGNTNTSNVYHTWIAVGGSDCINIHFT